MKDIGDHKQLEAMYRRRKLDIVYTQQCIQPLISSYSPQQQINLVFQRSNHCIDIGAVQLYYRPCIQIANPGAVDTDIVENGMTFVQKGMLGITPHNQTCMFSLSSVTVNGNQICSQPQQSLNRPRNIFQNYYNNMMSTKKKNALDGDHYTSGLIQSAGNGSRNTGFEENSITHPYVVHGPDDKNCFESRFESDPFPRAIISRVWGFNADFSISFSGNDIGKSQATYFSQVVATNADALMPPEPVAANQTPKYPCLPLSVTPSIAVYKSQQERFQQIRQRFLTQTITSYQTPQQNINEWGVTYEVCQIPRVVLPLTNVDGTTVAINDSPIFQGQQKVQWCKSIQGKYNGKSGSNAVNSNTARYLGTNPASSANMSYEPPELFTNLKCSLSELSCELQELGTFDMSDKQIIVQLQCNQPFNCLSAYLQPSLFMYGEAGEGASGVEICQFLGACTLGSATYQLTDLCCRIPYQTYPSESYSLIRQLLAQPKPYVSIRSQIDPIPFNTGGVFTQRLSIGGSSLIQAVVIFVIPTNQNTVLYSAGSALKPQDSMVNYLGCNPPSDLRYVYDSDSFYINFSDIYVQVDNKRFECNAVPLSNSALTNYLKTQDGIYSAFGKYLNIPLNAYIQNRFCYVIPINPFNDRESMITDQQIIISATIDNSSRIANSQAYNEFNQSCEGKFSLYSFAVTSQSLVNDYVKV